MANQKTTVGGAWLVQEEDEGTLHTQSLKCQ